MRAAAKPTGRMRLVAPDEWRAHLRVCQTRRLLMIARAVPGLRPVLVRGDGPLLRSPHAATNGVSA